MIQGHTETLIQGQTETLLQGHSSNASMQKTSSNRVEDSSYQDVSFSDLSRENSLKQADILHTYGWEARKKQDFRKAIEYYNKAIELNPQHFKAIFNRGFAFDKMG